MRGLTPTELKDWCTRHGVELDDRLTPLHPFRSALTVRCGFPKNISQLTWFCRFIEGSLQSHEDCLLWVTAWGVWPSSENWDLYYRLRRSYSEPRLIQEVPGHLFLKSEKADLVNFIEVGLISGWDMHLIPSAGSRHVFVSHDEWVEFALNDRVRAEQISADLKSAELKIYSFGRRLPLDR